MRRCFSEFGFVLIFFGERVLHLFETHVVHFRRVDMGTDELRTKFLGELYGEADARIGMIRIVN